MSRILWLLFVSFGVLLPWAGVQADDLDDHETVIDMDQAPPAVRTSVEKAIATHDDLVFHELEQCANGHYIAEFQGIDGEGRIEFAPDGSTVYAAGTCRIWPTVTNEALPSAIRTALHDLFPSNPPIRIDQRDLMNGREYHIRIDQGELHSRLILADDGTVRGLRSWRRR